MSFLPKFLRLQFLLEFSNMAFPQVPQGHFQYEQFHQFWRSHTFLTIFISFSEFLNNSLLTGYLQFCAAFFPILDSYEHRYMTQQVFIFNIHSTWAALAYRVWQRCPCLAQMKGCVNLKCFFALCIRLGMQLFDQKKNYNQISKSSGCLRNYFTLAFLSHYALAQWFWLI